MSNTRKISKTVSSVSDFKKAVEPIELPSGKVMRLKNPGLMSMANKGLIPNGLMVTIQKGIDAGKEPSVEDVMNSNVEIDDMVAMVDTIVIGCAVEPRLYKVPVWQIEDVETDRCKLEDIGEPADEKRDDERVYIDEVDDEDKMFIFQWSTGGTKDIEQFRRESANSMAAVAGRKAVARPTKRATPRKR